MMNEIERAIESCENRIIALRADMWDHPQRGNERQIHLEEIKLSALRSQHEREEPKPLTLEQLKLRIGKPVWVDAMGDWRIVIIAHDGINLNLYTAYNTVSARSVLDNGGRIYAHPPKEAPHDQT